MTYCVGLKLNRGLVFISDTLTNAGIDNINTNKKMFNWIIIVRYMKKFAHHLSTLSLFPQISLLMRDFDAFIIANG